VNSFLTAQQVSSDLYSAKVSEEKQGALGMGAAQQQHIKGHSCHFS